MTPGSKTGRQVACNYTGMKTRSLKEFGRKKILIIDDDEMLQSHLREYLELEEYQVSQARNGQEAIDYLLSLKKEDLPDLVLLDYMMPVMDGIRFSEERMKYPDLKALQVVMMTASSDLRRLSQTAFVEACVDKTAMDLDKLILNFIHRQKNSQFSFLA